MTKGKATKEKLYKRLAKEFEQKNGGLEKIKDQEELDDLLTL